MRQTKGFSLPLVIVIVVVFAAAGFVGWRVYDSNRVAQNDTPSSQQSEQQAQVADPNKGYDVIKEWGVRFKPIADATIIYKAWSVTGVPAGDGTGIPLPEGSMAVIFSTQELANTNPSCGVNEDSTAVWKLYRSPQPLPLNNNLLLGKIGDYYYYNFHAQASCVNDPADFDLNGKASQQVHDSFKTLELAK